jgi:hypothetical protein
MSFLKQVDERSHYYILSCWRHLLPLSKRYPKCPKHMYLSTKLEDLISPATGEQLIPLRGEASIE